MSFRSKFFVFFGLIILFCAFVPSANAKPSLSVGLMQTYEKGMEHVLAAALGAKGSVLRDDVGGIIKRKVLAPLVSMGVIGRYSGEFSTRNLDNIRISSGEATAFMTGMQFTETGFNWGNRLLNFGELEAMTLEGVAEAFQTAVDSRAFSELSTDEAEGQLFLIYSALVRYLGNVPEYLITKARESDPLTRFKELCLFLKGLESVTNQASYERLGGSRFILNDGIRDAFTRGADGKYPPASAYIREKFTTLLSRIQEAVIASHKAMGSDAKAAYEFEVMEAVANSQIICARFGLKSPREAQTVMDNAVAWLDRFADYVTIVPFGLRHAQSVPATVNFYNF